jgi:tetratricopeptide (TPR) repeat protein
LSIEDTPDVRKALGTAYAQRKDWGNAAKQFTAAIALDRYDEDTHFRLSQVYLYQQDFASAVQSLETARRVFDKSPQIELALGVAYYGLRQFERAVDQFLKTIRLAPEVPQPYLFLGRIVDHATERLPEVIEAFKQLEASEPKNSVGYALHAKALVLQLAPSGFPIEAQTALELAEKSLALKEENSEAHLQLGILLDRKKEYAEAATHLERSAQLNPRDPAVHYRLARVYDRLGRKEEAARQRELHEKLSEQEHNAGLDAIESATPAAGTAARK